MIDLKTLGTLDLRDSDGSEIRTVVSRPKRLALLVYLATARPRGFHRRDTLTALFWPELDQERARRALRQALYVLRRELGDGITGRGEEEVGVNRNRVRSDVVSFEALVESGAAAAGLELYTGDFLTGFYLTEHTEFERWVEQERLHLKTIAANASWTLAEEATAGTKGAAVRRWVESALHYAGDDEVALQRGLSLLNDAGDRAGALALYDSFTARLRADYEIEPSPETQQLIFLIRQRGVTAVGETSLRAEPLETEPRFRNPKHQLRHDVSTHPPPLLHTRLRKHRGVLVVGATIIVLAAAVRILPGIRDGTVPTTSNRILVTGFANRTGDTAHDWIGHMASEWLSQGLLGTEQFQVIWPRGDDQDTLLTGPRLADGPTAHQSVAREVGAALVVGGSYYGTGDTIQIQSHVMDALTGELVGALEPVTATSIDAVRAVEVLQQRLLGLLAVEFGSDVELFGVQPGRYPTMDAYQEYLAGLVANNRDAITHFLRAHETDPTFLAPLSNAAILLAQMGRVAEADSVLGILRPSRDYLNPLDRHFLDAAEGLLQGDLAGKYRAWRAASEIAPRFLRNFGVAGLHFGRYQEVIDAYNEIPESGRVRTYWWVLSAAHHFSGDLEGKLRIARRLRQEDPFRVRSLRMEVLGLAGLGRVEELRETLYEFETVNRAAAKYAYGEAAQELTLHGFQNDALDFIKPAIDYYAQRVENQPNSRRDRWLLGEALYLERDWDASAKIFAGLLRDHPAEVDYLGYVGVLAARRGLFEEAMRTSADLAALDLPFRPFTQGVQSIWRARIAALIGDRDAALELIRDGISRGYGYHLLHGHEIDWIGMKGYEPYERLLRPER